MGIMKALQNAIGGTLAEQWKDIITAPIFDEHTVVVPGIQRSVNNGRGTNVRGSAGVISNGSQIYVPENTASFIFSKSGIEQIITESGGYRYENGQSSIFNGENIGASIFQQIKERVGYGGISPDEKRIAFVNLREISDIKFGTRRPLVYNDLYYGIDLEILARGSFSIQIRDAEKFIKNFVPANVSFLSFDDRNVKERILTEFLQSFISAVNSLSNMYRISNIPEHIGDILSKMANDENNVGTWEERFGFEAVKIGIENIEFTEQSRKLVSQYSAKKMNVNAYEDISQKASDIAMQQKISNGIQKNGFGSMGNMIIGMNAANEFLGGAKEKQSISIEQQIELLKKLKELRDAGILTEEEFAIKKKEILGI